MIKCNKEDNKIEVYTTQPIIYHDLIKPSIVLTLGHVDITPSKSSKYESLDFYLRNITSNLISETSLNKKLPYSKLYLGDILDDDIAQIIAESFAYPEDRKGILFTSEQIKTLYNPLLKELNNYITSISNSKTEQ